MTRRVPENRPAEANISFTAPRDQVAAWQMRQYWCSRIGVDATTLVIPRQVHGSNVAIATEADAGAGATPRSTLIADADAIVTNRSGVSLMTTHADCLPILMYAPERGVIAAVHAGWRSTVSDVAGNTVSVMTTAFGASASEIHAFLGPAICASCYEVGTDVVDAWHRIDREDTTGAIVRDSGSTYFDLVAANRMLLQHAGIQVDQIELSRICTRCQGESWFSHRGQGPTTGRFGSIIALDSDSR
jgi:YfiH family protein